MITLKAKDWVQTIRGASFFNQAPNFFNILPKELQDTKYIDKPIPQPEAEFEKNLVNYQMTVPDDPLTQGLK